MKITELLQQLTSSWVVLPSADLSTVNVNRVRLQLADGKRTKQIGAVSLELKADQIVLTLNDDQRVATVVGRRGGQQKLTQNDCLLLMHDVGERLVSKVTVQSEISQVAITAISGGADDVFHQMSRLLHNPLVIYDLNGQKITAAVANDDIADKLTELMRDNSTEEWTKIREQWALKPLFGTHLRTVTVNEVTIPMLITPLINDDEPLGYLVVPAIQTQVEGMDTFLMPDLGKIASQVVMKTHLIPIAVSGRDRLLNMLLTEQEHAMFPTQFAKEHVHLPTGMVLLRCEPEAGQSPSVLKERLKYLFMPLFKQVLVTTHHHQCLALLSISLQEYNCETFLKKLQRVAGQAGCRLIVSNYYTHPEDTIAANMVCSRTAQLRSHDKTVVFCEDEFFDLVLARVHHIEILPFFINPALQALMDYDTANKTELVKTLDVYLLSTCNLTQTAKGLYVHPNTLRNRLAHITKLTGMDVKDAETCFKLASSFKVQRFLTKNKFTGGVMPTTDPENGHIRESDVDL